MSDILGFGYKALLKPFLFKSDAESVHEAFSKYGELLGSYKTTRAITRAFFNYEDASLKKTVNGIDFLNPVGLAAGFDYDGRMAKIMNCVGFGFNTVGTVTAKPYKGNRPPRLMRLPKSKSLLVNKGFKSVGVHKVAERLQKYKLDKEVYGVSVGSSNIAEVNTITKAIDDYVESFTALEKVQTVKYYELNISCPNTNMTENFIKVQNYKDLLSALKKLNLSKPVFVKMPNEIDFKKCDQLVKASMEQGINSFIFSNLVKDRQNPQLDSSEIEKNCRFKGKF